MFEAGSPGKIPRQKLRLIESSLPPPSPVQGDMSDHVDGFFGEEIPVCPFKKMSERNMKTGYASEFIVEN